MFILTNYRGKPHGHFFHDFLHATRDEKSHFKDNVFVILFSCSLGYESLHVKFNSTQRSANQKGAYLHILKVQ